MVLASCSRSDNDASLEPPNVEIRVWPVSYRNDLVRGLGLTAASPLTQPALSALSLAHGGSRAEPEITPNNLRCLAEVQPTPANSKIVQFHFSTFSGPRPALISFAFDEITGGVICADLFRPKE
jgi:hypothetical protein